MATGPAGSCAAAGAAGSWSHRARCRSSRCRQPLASAGGGGRPLPPQLRWGRAPRRRLPRRVGLLAGRRGRSPSRTLFPSMTNCLRSWLITPSTSWQPNGSTACASFSATSETCGGEGAQSDAGASQGGACARRWLGAAGHRGREWLAAACMRLQAAAAQRPCVPRPRHRQSDRPRARGRDHGDQALPPGLPARPPRRALLQPATGGRPLTFFPGLIIRMATSKAVRAAFTTSAARPVMGADRPPPATSTVVACVEIQPSIWQPRSLWAGSRGLVSRGQAGPARVALARCAAPPAMSSGSAGSAAVHAAAQLFKHPPPVKRPPLTQRRRSNPHLDEVAVLQGGGVISHWREVANDAIRGRRAPRGRFHGRRWECRWPVRSSDARRAPLPRRKASTKSSFGPLFRSRTHWRRCR
jgi:hypothetical protein